MAKSPRNLAGRVVAITGGARGIGRETALACVGRGMRVAIGDVDAAAATEAAEALGPAAHGYALDVTDRDSFAAFLDATEADLGPIDVLVNNAGIMPVGRFTDETDESTRRQIDINIWGVIHGMKLVLPRFEARGSGHLVNVASAAGKGGFAGVATYCGTKHFVVGISEAVRGELHGTGIEVSCVMPAFVNTELTTGLGSARGVKNIDPQDVAAAIVEALEHPHFDVFVPKSVGTIGKVTSLLPRGGREAIGRAMGVDQVMLNADHSKRAAYELRAARSEPGLEPGDETKRIPEKTG